MRITHNKKVISLSLDKEVVAQLEKIAKDDGQKISYVANEFLKGSLKAYCERDDKKNIAELKKLISFFEQSKTKSQVTKE